MSDAPQALIEAPHPISSPPQAAHARAPEAAMKQARMMAVAAIVVAVSAPFWIDRALGLVGLQTPAAARLAATRVGVDAEERRLAALEKQINAAIGELAQSRAEATQLKASTDALAPWSRLYALTDLAAALRQSEPFGLQIAVARSVASLPDDIARLLDQLAPYATIGVPDADRINREFASRAARLGWNAQELARFAVVNRVIAWSSRQIPGAASPDDETRRRLAAASNELGAGDIGAAVESVSQLEGPARDTFADWLQDAGARAAADRLSRQVDVMITRGRPAAPAAHQTPASGTRP